MAEREPTPQQREAIVAAGPIAVRAGAGSGKTTVLAERYVHLLRPSASGAARPEVTRLLAITFTEKAAAEMRARIRALIARELACRPEERDHWAQAQRDLLGAHISTIHAFCARVVREHPIETGIDPDARVLDADEARRYLDARVEHHLLDLAGAAHPGAAALLRRGRGLRGGRYGGAVGLAIGLLETTWRLGRRGGWLRDAGATPPPASAGRELADALARLVEAGLAGKRTKGAARLADGWPAWKATLGRFADAGADEVAAAAPMLRDLARALSGARLKEETEALLRTERGRLYGRLVETAASRIMGAESAAIADLLAGVDDRLRADKRRDAVLTFDDLVLVARDLVVEHPAARAALARRFDAVLLDECQDTDPAQAALLGAITRDGGPDLFVVGDEKQAIYGFRGADVEVFERLLRELPARTALGHNFRSVPSILAFVNAVGPRLLESPADAALPAAWTTFGPEHVLTPEREEAAPPTAVRLVTVARELLRRGKPNAAARRELEARVLAEVVHGLLHDPAAPVRAADVTVLLRSLREVKVYEHALARRGVPYHVVGGRGFFQRQEVRDVVSLLALVADPRDDAALAAVLRSPWVGLSDDALWGLARQGRSLRDGFERAAGTADEPPALASFRTRVAELRALRSRGAPSEVLVRALETFDLDAVLLALPRGEQQAANVRKVLDLARAFEQGAHGGLPELVAWIRRRDDEDGDEPEALLASEEGDVVRLMTIHQAKGLEFPVVVLADLGRALRSDYDAVVVDEEVGVIAAPLVGAGGYPLAPTELLRHRARLGERARAEHARLFYVACTRARDRLVLIDGTTPPDRLEGKAAKPPESWGHVVWDLIGHDRILAAGAAAEPVLVEIEGDARVLVEPASRWLPAVPPAWEEEPPAGVATAGTAGLDRLVDDAIAPPPRVAGTTECTPTEIAEFRECPRRWWYQSVVGLREPGRSGRRARVLGSIVHAALERWTAGAAGDAAAALGPGLALRVADPAVRAEVTADVARAIDWLEAERAAGTRLLGREVPFVAALAPDVVVRGRIDAVLAREGRVVVRDYKYARAPAVVDDVYRDQLAIYALAMARAGQPAAGTELLFLRPAPTVRTVSVPDAAAATTAAVEAARAIGAARAARDPAAAPRGPAEPGACRGLGCGYVRRCWVSGSARDAPARTAGA